MNNIQPLEYDTYYHIYNRGINSENLFREEDNYLHFMNLYSIHIDLVAETLVYCLMKNHFHLLVYIFPQEMIQYIKPKEGDSRIYTEKKRYNPSWQFANLFDAYAKAINKRYKRTGSLFETPFRRIIIGDELQLRELVRYIHNNPVKHGFVDSITDYPWSSFSKIVSSESGTIGKDVIDLFGSRGEFLEFHNRDDYEADMESY